MHIKSFKAQLLTFCLSCYLSLWLVFLLIITSMFRENIDRIYSAQQKWLAIYASTFISDLKIGNQLAVRAKLNALVEKDAFTEVAVSASNVRLTDSRAKDERDLTGRSWLTFLMPDRTVKIDIRDEYNTSWGTFTAVLDRNYLLEPLQHAISLYGRISLSLFLILLGAIILLLHRYSGPLEKLTAHILQFAKPGNTADNLQTLFQKSLPMNNLELSLLRDAFNNAFRNLVALEDKVQEQKVHAQMTKVALQVAHDIRSPLAAIAMTASQASGVSTAEQRQILTLAAAQIKLIADDLLKRYQTTKSPSLGDGFVGPTFPAQLVIFHVEALVPSLQIQCKARKDIVLTLEATMPSVRWAFAGFEPLTLGRVLSNIVQNAVEAIGEKGTIVIRVISMGTDLAIEVEDSGKGIPAEVLSRLLTQGGSYQKSGGTGFGLSHAITTLRSWGGDVLVSSVPNRGTRVLLVLPTVPPPSGIVSGLSFVKAGSIVVLDDDSLIHSAWALKLSEGISNGSLYLQTFARASDLAKWVERSPDLAKKSLFLVDYDLGAGVPNGLEVIEDLSLAKQAILVTGQDKNQEVLRSIIKAGVRLLPKELIPWVPITA